MFKRVVVKFKENKKFKSLIKYKFKNRKKSN